MKLLPPSDTSTIVDALVRRSRDMLEAAAAEGVTNTRVSEALVTGANKIQALANRIENAEDLYLEEAPPIEEAARARGAL